MKKIIYHGSERIIKAPTFGTGSMHNDYGRAFYCTEDKELSKEWACKAGNDGFSNAYSIDLDGLSILNLNEKPYNILNWLAVLTRYRTYWQKNSIAEEAKKYLQEHFYVDVDSYDVIIGYRADDSYFSFAQDFIMGTISLQKLSRAMRLGKLGEQIVIKSERAFSQICYQGYEIASAEEYFVKKQTRDIKARRDYSAEKNKISAVDEIYMIDIMRGRVNEDELHI